jgi:transposase
MVFELREQTGEKTGTIVRVADQLGVHREALRTWVRQAEVDAGKRPGTTGSDAQRLAELERENRELRRANEILKRHVTRAPRRLASALEHDRRFPGMLRSPITFRIRVSHQA